MHKHLPCSFRNFPDAHLPPVCPLPWATPPHPIPGGMIAIGDANRLQKVFHFSAVRRLKIASSEKLSWPPKREGGECTVNPIILGVRVACCRVFVFPRLCCLWPRGQVRATFPLHIKGFTLCMLYVQGSSVSNAVIYDITAVGRARFTLRTDLPAQCPGHTFSRPHRAKAATGVKM